jgi:DNA-binding NarL/FixJ family response regulator
LLVDDEPYLLHGLTEKFRGQTDVEVRSTYCPQDVVSLAREFLPRLIVCDINMRPIDGGEVASALGRDMATAPIPLVFLTSLVDPSQVARSAGRVGGRAMISKLASPREIMERIRLAAGLPARPEDAPGPT